MNSSRLFSQEKPIKQKDFGGIPSEWWDEGDKGRRKISHEEVLRDLNKSAEQLLIDTHDESLNLNRRLGESILRTLARMASMQLKIQKEQRITNLLLFVFTLLAMIFGGIQAWFTIWPRGNPQVSVVAPTYLSPQSSDQTHLLVPLAPIKPLELEIVLKKTKTTE